MRIYVHVLVILSFVLAGVSPACAFISGKHTIEICAADGSVRTVDVSAEYAPFDLAPDEEPVDVVSSDDCGFCFNQSHFDHLNVDVFALKAAFINVDLSKIYVHSAISQTRRFYQGRAPPVLS